MPEERLTHGEGICEGEVGRSERDGGPTHESELDDLPRICRIL